MQLHSQARALLSHIADWSQRTGVPPREAQSLADSRAVFESMSALRLTGPAPEVASITDATLPTRGGMLRARVIRPGGSRLPTLIYLHGGGYVVGSVVATESEARRFAAAVPANVVSISYRLAPEHPWPAAVDDVEDAVLAIAGGAVPDLAVGALALVGSSAGAGAAAAATRRLLKRDTAPIGLLVLLSPWLDLTLTSPSTSLFGTGYLLERTVLEGYCGHYVPPGLGRDHPELSPARHPVPAGWPRTLVFGAASDPLADDAALFTRRLAEAGVRHSSRIVPGMPHGFNGWWQHLPVLRPELDGLDAAIRVWTSERTS
jgi:acetyl esterase